MQLQEERIKDSKLFLSLIGVCLSLLAFCVAATSPFIIAELDPSPPIEDVAIDKAFEIKDKIMSRLTGNEEQKNSPEETSNTFSFADTLVLSVIATGLLGMIFGVLGFIRHEQKRASLAAILIGIGAIILQYSLIIAAILILITFIGTILNSLGIDL